MNTRSIKGRTTVLLMGVIGLASASMACAQGYESASSALMIRGGQGNLIAMPATTPVPVGYALTGETTESAQARQAWEKSVGPVYQFGNGRVVVSTER